MATMTSPSRSYEYTVKLGKERIYLTQFGRIGMQAYAQVVSGKRTVDELAAELRATSHQDENKALAVRFALLGVEQARAAGGTKAILDLAARDAAVRALKALEDEIFVYPAPPPAPVQPDTCRHGVSFAVACSQCGE